MLTGGTPDFSTIKAQADEAVAQAERNGVKVDKVLIWRRYPGKYSSPTPVVEGRDYFVDELLEEYRGENGSPGVHARRGAPVSDVHKRHYGKAQGMPA